MKASLLTERRRQSSRARARTRNFYFQFFPHFLIPCAEKPINKGFVRCEEIVNEAKKEVNTPKPKSLGIKHYE